MKINKIWCSIIVIIFLSSGQCSTVKNVPNFMENITKYLDKSVNPCDNFYNYACGKWPLLNPATRGQYETSPLQNAKEDMENKMINILATQRDGDLDIFRSVKNFYQSCLDLKSVERNFYKQKLMEIIDEFGKMPALEGEAWKASGFDWLRTVAEISFKYNIRIIYGYTIDVDFKNNSLNQIYVGHPDFALKKPSMYLEAGNAKYRLNYQSGISLNLKEYLNISPNMADQIAKEILEFEVSLVKGMVKHTFAGRELQSLTSVVKLDSIYKPELNVTKLLYIALGGSLPRDNIIEKNPGYQLNLLEVMEQTPKRIVANYIYYNLVVSFILKTPEVQRDLELKCMRQTKTYFPYVLENMVYNELKSSDIEKAIYNIFENLKINFQKDFESQKYNWINERTRKLAIEKLKSMKLEINSYKNFNFSEEYGNSVLERDSYMYNLKNIFQYNALKMRLKLNKNPEKYYGGFGVSFGPRYILIENTIKIPIAILQSNYFWSQDYPLALNYGRLGFLIAHEIIHGFEDEGQTFDHMGNEREWWDVSSMRDFNRRTLCFRNQYTKLANVRRTLLPRHVWQSENIADNGGVKLAFDSFMNVDLNSTLMQLEFSQKQLFFLGFAQLWCNDIYPDIREMKLATDSHAPSHLRVIGALSNFGEFSRAFSCPRGREMSPVAKCEIF